VIATGEALTDMAADDGDPLVGRLGADAAQLTRLKNVSRWISGDPFMLPPSAGAPAMLLNDIVNTVYEYLNLLLLLDAAGVYIGGRELRRRGPAVLRVVAAIGEVDAAISVASVRAGRSDWTRPAFTPPGSPAAFSGVRHPLLPDAVPNTISLAPGKGALITGSNMSGKSTFLRTVGVTTVLAQTLNTCFATEYAAPVFTVRSCIGRADDLLTGRSYYIAEVEALLALVEAGGAPAAHLFLLDELFRGTNAVERIAAGQAVLRELLVPGGRTSVHVALAATHDGELVDLLPDVYTAHHFGDELGPGGLEFDHRLRPGPATTRNAIALLRLHGAPEGLVARAVACAQALDRQRGVVVKAR
jgi:DNA mismatch repair ATPase MutS